MYCIYYTVHCALLACWLRAGGQVARHAATVSDRADGAARRGVCVCAFVCVCVCVRTRAPVPVHVHSWAATAAVVHKLLHVSRLMCPVFTVLVWCALVACVQNEELYMSIISERYNDLILFHAQGGVNVGDVDAKVSSWLYLYYSYLLLVHSDAPLTVHCTCTIHYYLRIYLIHYRITTLILPIYECIQWFINVAIAHMKVKVVFPRIKWLCAHILSL